GEDSRALYTASPARRRAIALAALGRYFGELARHPRGYYDMVWAREAYTRGAYGTYNPPGVITTLGRMAPGAVGPLHLASADGSVGQLAPGPTTRESSSEVAGSDGTERFGAAKLNADVRSPVTDRRQWLR